MGKHYCHDCDSVHTKEKGCKEHYYRNEGGLVILKAPMLLATTLTSLIKRFTMWDWFIMALIIIAGLVFMEDADRSGEG